MKYNLTRWQKLWLTFFWVYWKLSINENKKTWHEVKKGIEKHEHKFTKYYYESGYKYLMCEHEGCNLCRHDPYIF